MGSAFAGVFAPRETGSADVVRKRLEAALSPDGGCRRFDDGPLSVAWTEEIDFDIAEDGGAVCLLDGHLHERPELSPRPDLPGDAGPSRLLAKGYPELGPGLLAELRGDFSLLLWSPEAAAGLLARDQLGVRPLFLHRSGGWIAFASEARNLVRLLPRRPDPDPLAISHWVSAMPLPDERTLFEGIEALAPATYLSLAPRAVEATRYWAPRYRPRRRLGPVEAGALLRPALERAVRRRAGPSDGGAVLLSGGIDSGSVAGIAASASASGSRPGRSYSAVFPRHPETDETPLIRLLASRTGLRATGLQLEGGGVLGGALPFLESWELPPTTPNLFFLHPLLRRAALDGVGVLLDGEGGDAVFWHAPGLLADRIRHGRLLSAWSLAGRFPEYGVPTTWRIRLGQLRRWGRRRGFDPAPPPWLGSLPVPGPRSDPTSGREGPPWWSEHVDGILGPGSRMMLDTSRRHGALNGIEPRHPLLDLDLIELAVSFPPELAFDRRYNRPLLRDAVRGLIPDEVRLRPYKSNFDRILVEALDADLPVIDRLLTAPGAEIAAFADRRALATHLASPPAELGARRRWALATWHLVTMECWLRRQAGEDLLPRELSKQLRPVEYSIVSLSNGS